MLHETRIANCFLFCEYTVRITGVYFFFCQRCRIVNYELENDLCGHLEFYFHRKY